jgi:hypothetical protein
LVQEGQEAVKEGRSALKEITDQKLVTDKAPSPGEERPEVSEPDKKTELPKPIEVPGDVE